MTHKGRQLSEEKLGRSSMEVFKQERHDSPPPEHAWCLTVCGVGGEWIFIPFCSSKIMLYAGIKCINVIQGDHKDPPKLAGVDFLSFTSPFSPPGSPFPCFLLSFLLSNHPFCPNLQLYLLFIFSIYSPPFLPLGSQSS